jgi:hypothetical protein
MWIWIVSYKENPMAAYVAKVDANKHIIAHQLFG